MPNSGKSLVAFDIYMIVLGVVLLIEPDWFLRLFGLPLEGQIWLRVIAVLLFIFAYMGISAARKDMTEVIHWTIHGRLSATVLFTSFVVLGVGPKIMLLFAALDFVSVMWTILALRSEGRLSLPLLRGA